MDKKYYAATTPEEAKHETDFKLFKYREISKTDKMKSEAKEHFMRGLTSPSFLAESNEYEPEKHRDLEDLHNKLKGAETHTSGMMYLQLHLYVELRPELVEKEGYDLLDTENKIMAEIFGIEGTDATHLMYKPIVRFFSGKHLLRSEDELEEWSFYHVTNRNRINIREVVLTDEFIEFLKEVMVEAQRYD